MLTEEQERYLARFLRQIQIIVLALFAGPTVFLAYVLFTRGGQPQNLQTSYMAAGFAALAFLAWAIVPQVIVAVNCRKIAAGEKPYRGRPGTSPPPGMEQTSQLVAVFQTRLIIASAILEGAAFYNVFAYMVEGQTWTLAIVAALLLAILASFPTQGRLFGFVRRQLESMEQFPP